MKEIVVRMKQRRSEPIGTLDDRKLLQFQLAPQALAPFGGKLSCHGQEVGMADPAYQNPRRRHGYKSLDAGYK